MKQRIFSMMKRWWVIALVFTLALSLTSCARRRPSQNSLYGKATCGPGTVGTLSVYTIRNPALPGTYLISIIVDGANTPGDLVSITAANSSTLAYKPLISDIPVNPGAEISVPGYLTDDELNNFDEIVFNPVLAEEAGLTFLQKSGDQAQVCYLPAPGETDE